MYFRELEDMALQQSNLVSKIMKEEAELEMLHTELKTLREKNFGEHLVLINMMPECI